MSSLLMLTWCCCPPRSCPCGEHAPHHLRSHRDPRVHPLPGGGRAPGHAGQVEQGRASPANREGNGAPGEGRWGHRGGFRPSCPQETAGSTTRHPVGPLLLEESHGWDGAAFPYQLRAELIPVLVPTVVILCLPHLMPSSP